MAISCRVERRNKQAADWFAGLIVLVLVLSLILVGYAIHRKSLTNKRAFNDTNIKTTCTYSPEAFISLKSVAVKT